VSSIAVQPSGGKYQTLYSFSYSDGAHPYAGLINVNNTLYGTTENGGPSSAGTVFAMSVSGKKESVLHSFGTGVDGLYPESGLIYVNGSLYGTTYNGGASKGGTVFAVSTSGVESVLHSFEACCGTGTDGSYPNNAGLVNVDGVLYGTTGTGGAYACYSSQQGCGTVFAVNTSGVESVIHSFVGGFNDGDYPLAGLIYVNSDLYGTTENGGTSNGGTVFAVSTSGVESVLHSFGSGTDGSRPQASLIDMNGTLYGTTSVGGTGGGGTDCNSGLGSGCGTVFAVSTSSGAERVLYSFQGGTDGSYPQASLIEVKGTLYGTTYYGGASNAGTVFAVSTSGVESVLHSFGSGKDGSNPQASLIYVNGALYGTTYYGGAGSAGTVFEISL